MRQSRTRAAGPHHRPLCPSSPSIVTLQRELQGRFVSKGGRPADPAPTIRRLVTVKKDVWRELNRQASALSKLGHRITPGQLAAMMLERTVSPTLTRE
jgi:hypothetical protein